MKLLGNFMLFQQALLQRVRQHQYRFVLLFALVFLFTLLSGTGLVLPSLQDSSHALVFGLATNILLLTIIPNDLDHQNTISEKIRARYVLSICFSAFAFGVFVELIQPFFGRDKSLLDASYDLAGCTAAGLFYWRDHTKQAHTKPTLLLVAWIQLLSCFIIPASNFLVVLQREFAAPMLVSFDASWEKNIRSINNGTHFSIVPAPVSWDHSSLVGRFSLGNASYPGISFPYIYSDWSGYSTLSFSVFSEHPKAITLHLRIHDAQHNNKYSDRFHQKLSIEPGLNEIQIDLAKVKYSPKGREFDLGDVISLAIFMSRPKEQVTLFIDDIQLN